MAQRIVNTEIQFAYASDNIEVELKLELEKYFLYQNILILDSHYEFGGVIDKLQHSAKCNFVVERKIDKTINFDDYACIICVNSNYLNEIKQVCSSKNIPYIIALTKVCDGLGFKKFAFTKDFKTVKTNAPLGVVFATDLIFNKTDFICKVILEISSLSFLNLQNKVCNMFYDNKLKFYSYDKLFTDIKNCSKNNIDKSYDVKEFSKIYLNYAIQISKFPTNVLDNLIQILKYIEELDKNNILKLNDFLTEIKYAFILMITSIENNFFLYYTDKLKNTVDYEKHIVNSCMLKVKPKLCYLSIPNNKLVYILNDFRDKLINDVNEEIEIQTNIKNLIADIDVNYLYKTFERLKDFDLKKYLSLEQDFFDSQNFLSILYQCGLLNFEI